MEKLSQSERAATPTPALANGTAQPASRWAFLIPARYDRRHFRRDLVAGLTVAAVAIPQAMAYAIIAGIDPRYGLYTAVVMTALGSLFGSSSHLMNGPTNAISLVVFSAIAHLGPLPPDRAVQAVFLLSLLVGGIQILIALLKLGDLTRYVSEAVILGFMTGAGLLIALGQVPNLLGLPSLEDGKAHLLVRLWWSLTSGHAVDLHAVALGVGTAAIVIALRWGGRRWEAPIPDMLIALIIASVVAWLCNWPEQGPGFARGLPSFHVPLFDTHWLRPLSGSALAIALLGLLEALAVAKSIAARTRQPLDYNQQCLAEGLANLGGGLFQCMPGSGSLSRSAINFHAGAYSRMSGIYSAAAVAVIILAFAPLTRYVPKPALAGILLVTAWRIVDRTRLRYCLKATRFDAGITLATALFALINVEYSILLGTLLSFMLFIPRASRLKSSELIATSDRLVRERLPGDPRCSKMAMVALEGELFFGALPELNECLQDLERRAEAGVRVVVLRVKRTRNPDMVCLERLQHFLKDMRAKNVEVLLCGVRPDFAEVIHNLGFHEWLPPECIFLEEPAAGSATLKAVQRAYEILGTDLCPTCPQRAPKTDREWDYMI